MKRRWPEITFWPNPLMWEWRTVRFDDCVIYHRGPVTITTYKGATAWKLR